MKTQRISPIVLLLIIVIIILAFMPHPTNASGIMRPPGATNTPEPTQEPTPEPTCLPPSPDYPEPCHEHDRGIFTDVIYLPLVEKQP